MEEPEPQTVAALVEFFTKDLAELAKTPPVSPNKALCVAVTGTTGLVGRAILSRLIIDPNISSIYCLNRSRAAQEDFFDKTEQNDAMESLLGHVQFCTAYIGEERLGLSDPKYAELLREVHVIVHCAWLMDLELPVEKFKFPHLRGLRNLMDLSARAQHRPRVVFMSSLSAIREWKDPSSSDFLGDYEVSEQETVTLTGYAQSKQTAERMLDMAVQRSSTSVTIVRLGAVIGNEALSASWSEYDWFPQLLRASATLQMLPSEMPDLHFVTVDSLADMVAEILLHPGNSITVYNLIDTHAASWSVLRPCIIEALHSGTRLVTPTDWKRSFRDHLESRQQVESEAFKAGMTLLRLMDEMAGSLIASGGDDTTFGNILDAADSSGVRDRLISHAHLSARVGLVGWMQRWLN